jgi:hypothetical protein
MTDMQTVAVDRVTKGLDRIVDWVKRGTLHQFYNEMNARLAEDETYCVDLEDDAVVFSRIRHAGGFLGIGVRTVKEPVLEIHKKDGVVAVRDEPQDTDFVLMLATHLEEH